VTAIGVLWKLIGTVFAVSALGLGTLQAVVRLGHEQERVDRTFEDVAAIDTLVVDVNDGRVDIVGRATSSIRLSGTIDHGLVRTQHSEAIEGDRIVIRTDCNHLLSAFCDVDYTLEVPQDLDVVVRSGNGTATITGMTGAIEASTGNGSVEVAGAVGDLRLESDNGSVEATEISSPTVHATTGNGGIELTFRDPPRDVEASSGNGSVEIVLPDLPDVAYRVDSATGHGSETIRVRTDPASDRVIDVSTGNGSVTVRY
jgi:hypothetical protein